ncbi:hypothetical protein HAZT_HAZT004571 [Hyalella azteca]|uniref:Major facilitator superfamily associated domain-containing protein n=1 Tax=Hyalella azteca TaxID=294128 RepID=A0A6A0HA62_HYAAZ|nr:hypothetical protein HAZT_HAZT004571 [Hyalella azteca]
MAPVVPFGLVISLQLGASVSLMGTVGAVILMISVVVKPFFSTLADAFPLTRRPLFVGMVLLCCLSLSGVAFIPQFTKAPCYADAWIVQRDMFNSSSFSFKSGNVATEVSLPQGLELAQSDLLPNYIVNQTFSKPGCGENSVTEHLGSSNKTSLPWEDLFIVLPNNGSCELEAGRDCQFTWTSALLQLTLVNSSSDFSTYAVAAPGDASVQYLRTSNLSLACSLKCVGGQWATTECGGNPLRSRAFWFLVVLNVVSEISYSTSNSFTDAISMDKLGKDGDYGSQRLWGVLGWGLLGPLASFLVDWHSGEAQTKDYTPAFILVAVFLGLDVIVASRLKVPVLKVEEDTVWKAVKPLLKQFHFFVYLLSSLMSGVLNAVPNIYLFA